MSNLISCNIFVKRKTYIANKIRHVKKILKIKYYFISLKYMYLTPVSQKYFA